MARLRVFWGIIRPFRGRLLLAVFLTVVLTSLSALPPLVMQYLIDDVATKKNWHLMVPAVLFVTLLPIWSAWFTFLNRVYISAIGQRLVVDLRTNLYEHVLNLSMRFHGKVGAGPLMSRLMTDVGIVQNMVTGETLATLSSGGMLIFGVAMAFHINFRLAWVVVIAIGLCALNYRKYSRLIRTANLELREMMDEVTGTLQERLAGVRLVKTYCRERDETNAFLVSTDKALEIGMRSQMLSVSLNTSARLIVGLLSTVVWCGAVWFILKGEDGMTYGKLQAITAYLWMALNPAINLTMVADTLVQATTSLDRILDVTNTPQDIVERKDAYELPAVSGELKFEAVDFAYEPGSPLFQHLDMTFPAGKMTALVGHTGCGKTTVTSLLMRLWEVQGGAVTLDGHDVRDITLRSLRRHIGVVPQESVMFEGSISSNIAYGMPEATQEQIEEAAQAAQIHDFIMTLPDGYASWLGKGGVQISVGQKQRIAIARAILLKPAVLILDEATSSLDSESEAAIQLAMKIILKGRTSVVVAHRLSTITAADQIIAMDHGEIKEKGTHDELMQIEGGLYQRLYHELQGKHEDEVSL